MAIYFVRNDIVKMEVDAVVLPANELLMEGPGASTAIYEAAGRDALSSACRRIGYCPMGGCRVTDGFHLPAKYILHAVVPLWQGGNEGEADYLHLAYRNALKKAAEHDMKSVAFPVLSSGNFRYPKEEALEIAVSEIEGFLSEHDMDVYVVLFGGSMLGAAKKLTESIAEYIDDNYVAEKSEEIYPNKDYKRSRSILPRRRGLSGTDRAETLQSAVESSMSADMEADLVMPCGAAYSEVPPFDPGKSFMETLFDLIDARGLSDPECYKRSNIDRKVFSKIRNNPGYTPKKTTIMALCIGLRLSVPEAEDLLSRAGYAFSPCSQFDLAVKYFLETGNYKSIHYVNIALFEMFGETLN